ncbi:MAG: MgtC/SapB family protein [archaeon]
MADLVSVEVIIKIVFAMILGGLVGLEREGRGRPAGLRTNMLVCLGATILVMVTQHAFIANVDSAARVIAGIITGIGFLGAGTIINAHNHVHGLTTAASVWAVAGIGVILGLGYYFVALVGTAAILLVLKMYKVELYLHRNG